MEWIHIWSTLFLGGSVATPGVGVRGVGADAAGVGYSRGVGGNLGGPVNRVGVR